MHYQLNDRRHFETINRADALAEKLRQEPYHLLTNDCIIKSFRLKHQLKREGIMAKVFVCLGIAQARWFGKWLKIPVFHAWVVVKGIRIETSRPLGTSGIWHIVPKDIEPLVGGWF